MNLREAEQTLLLPGDHRSDESSAGYSFTGCSPAVPTSASPAATSFSHYPAAVNCSAAKRNLSPFSLSHSRGPLQSVASFQLKRSGRFCSLIAFSGQAFTQSPHPRQASGSRTNACFPPCTQQFEPPHQWEFGFLLRRDSPDSEDVVRTNRNARSCRFAARGVDDRHHNTRFKLAIGVRFHRRPSPINRNGRMGHPTCVTVCKFLRIRCPAPLGCSYNNRCLTLRICHDPHLLLVVRLINHVRLDETRNTSSCLANPIASII